MVGRLKVWDFIAATKKTFSKITIMQVESPELKKMFKLCAGRVQIFLYSLLYRTLKLTFLTDVGSIILDEQIMLEISTGA